MQKRLIFINAFMSIAQVFIVGITLFFLYRFLLKTIGVEQFGIWSLVLATTSIAQVANFGISGSIVKFVAKYSARGEYHNISEIIQTAVISLAVIIGFVVLLCYPLIEWFLSLIIPQKSIGYAIKLLPYALFSLWLTVIIGVFQSGFDGLQKIYIRNILMISSSVFYALLCFLIVSKEGLIGLAYAQVINNLMFFIISWFLIKRFIPMLPVIPYKWNRFLFKESISYGINFQVISITIMLYDPTTKMLLGKFGGLSFVGYYEMANRMVQQFRAFIISANQVLVPAIANLQETNPEKINIVYLTSYNLLFYLALPLYTLIIISTPLISEVWIGHYEKVFAIFGILLSIGNFLNTLAGPSYFANLGTGNLRWNVISHVAIAFLNVVFGVIFGLFFDGYGVVVAWVIALSLGSAIIYIAYHLMNNISLKELLPKESRMLSYFCLSTIVVSLMIQFKPNHNLNIITHSAMLIIAFSFSILIPLYLHPMRKRLVDWLRESLHRKTGV